MAGVVTAPARSAHAPAAVALAVLLERLVQLLRHTSTAGELSVAAAAVLAALEREGPARLSDLAARQRISQPGMTQLVRRLEGDALVRRCGDPGDGRVVVVTLTPAGRAVLQARRRQRAAAVGELLARLGEQDRTVIEAALPALQRLVAAADRDR